LWAVGGGGAQRTAQALEKNVGKASSLEGMPSEMGPKGVTKILERDQERGKNEKVLATGGEINLKKKRGRDSGKTGNLKPGGEQAAFVRPGQTGIAAIRKAVNTVFRGEWDPIHH